MESASRRSGNWMELSAAVQIVAFVLFSLLAVGGALGMATTMSMFRSGILLMASFIGVAGLFLLLLADLLALLQVMMYIGGMLVMILFMVLFSHDPGGEMMTRMMKLPLIEAIFSSGLAHPTCDGSGRSGEHAYDGGDSHGGEAAGGEHGQEQGHGGDGHGMDMEGMSMTTPIKRLAALIASVTGILLAGLILLRPAWPERYAMPDPDSPARIGHLLMGKYMMAFEGAGLMILLGVFGAALLAMPGAYPDAADRERLRAAVAENPPPSDAEPLDPVHSLEDLSGGKEGRS